MKKLTVFFLIAAMAVLATGVPAQEGLHKVHHYFMRGNVLEKTGSDVFVCIGSRDNAQAGQVLDVIEMRKGPAGPKGVPTFIRNKIGSVKIVQVIDEHMARAAVVSGKVDVGSIVEVKVSLQ